MDIHRRVWENITGILTNPLYRNSLYISSSKIINAALVGFLFWTIAARLYSIEDIGVGSALLSSIAVIVAFSSVGLDFALIRYISIYDRETVFNTSLWVTMLSTTLFSISYLILIDIISPSIAFIREYAVLFVILTIFQSYIYMTGRAYIAIKESKFFLYQNLLLALRIPLLLPLVFLNSLGIYLAVGVGFFLTAIYTSLMLRRHIKIRFSFDRKLLTAMFSFSSINYFSSMFSTVPHYLLPIFALNLLGAENAAKYYIAYAIGGVILIIPDAISLSFFVEGSHRNRTTSKDLKRVLSSLILILIPAVGFIFLFGDKLLLLFGSSYKSAFNLLKLFAISSFFVAVYHLFISVQNIRMNPKIHLFLNMINAVLFLGLSYLGALMFGLNGLGYAWILTYIILNLGIIVYTMFFFNRSRRVKSWLWWKRGAV